MSQSEDNTTGIPTRAIHDAYLDMQRALKQYRIAADSGDTAAVDDAHGGVQETVLTLYELLRPHLKHNDAVTDYWDGEPPSYPRQNGHAPDPDDGKGVLSSQSRTDSLSPDGETAEQLDGIDTLADAHDVLGLNGDVRITGMIPNGDTIVVQYDAYQLGLRQLDDWGTEFRTTQTTIGGFLGAEKRTETERVRVDMPKLKRAARELGDVAEKLGALSEFESTESRTEIPQELIEDVNKWRKANLET